MVTLLYGSISIAAYCAHPKGPKKASVACNQPACLAFAGGACVLWSGVCGWRRRRASISHTQHVSSDDLAPSACVATTHPQRSSQRIYTFRTPSKMRCHISRGFNKFNSTQSVLCVFVVDRAPTPSPTRPSSPRLRLPLPRPTTVPRPTLSQTSAAL